MKKIPWIGTALLLVTFFSPPAPAHGNDSTTWNMKMQKLAKTLNELLIDLSSDSNFKSADGQKRIGKNAKEFARLSHSLKTSPQAPADFDPSIPMLASIFSQEADRAYSAWNDGHRDYARNLLRSMTGFCIACHTRNGSGPAFVTSEADPRLSKLRPLEKGDYFASVRQFDHAVDEYSRIIGDSNTAATRPFEWERAARASLAIAIRVKSDPARATTLVDQIIATPKAPSFLREQAQAWKRSIDQWKAEAPRQAMTEEGLYAEAIRLIADAKSSQKYPADRSADVLYLRASRTLHELLSQAPQGRHAAEALYLSGISYEVLRGPALWDLHEAYYAACVQAVPGTEMSLQCFRQFERSVYEGYTGSSGTHVPSDVQRRLGDLEKAARPESKQPEQKLR